MRPALRWNRPGRARAVLVLAHGAGAPMDSPFMDALAARLVDHGIAVARFEFPYMRRRRDTGVKAPPDRAPKLLAAFSEAVAEVMAEKHAECGREGGVAAPVWVGGKSLGGRVASMLAAGVAGDPGVAPPVSLAGVVAFGYPFHPPGKPEKTRLAHFPDLTLPMLICQGERDPFGKPEEVAAYALPDRVTLAWINDGDHDLKPRRRSGLSHEHNLRAAAARAAGFMLPTASP